MPTYRTEPLQTWGKIKEMRQKHFLSIMNAREEGKLLAVSQLNAPKEVLQGIGEVVHFTSESFAADIARYQDLALECMEEVEKRGFARDLCSYMRLHWGSMLLNKSPWGGFPKPDFAFQFTMCDSQAKWYQFTSEYLGIPYFAAEVPYDGGDGTHRVKESHVDYCVGQFEEFIDWLEKFSGRQYDDDRLIEAVSNYYICRRLYAEIMQLNQAVPAPLEMKSLYSLFIPAEFFPHKKEAVEVYRELYDEVKYRVDNQIAGVANEQRRLLYEGLPPWSFLDFLRYLKYNGIAVVGGTYQFHHLQEGRFEPDKPAEYEPLPRNRQEALRLRARAMVEQLKMGEDIPLKVKDIMAAVKAWKCDGVVLMINRGCYHRSLGVMEIRAALRQAGIPTMLYEMNMADHRDWSQVQIMDAMESFIESLGVAPVAA